ncbi:MAG: hypothetical protein LAO05_13775, partial [Acidobacteriia bacterium]|nr:hypothetical protein [Terriglobia bacterium]
VPAPFLPTSMVAAQPSRESVPRRTAPTLEGRVLTLAGTASDPPPDASVPVPVVQVLATAADAPVEVASAQVPGVREPRRLVMLQGLAVQARRGPAEERPASPQTARGLLPELRSALMLRRDWRVCSRGMRP